jgi:hypothetical protein
VVHSELIDCVNGTKSIAAHNLKTQEAHSHAKKMQAAKRAARVKLVEEFSLPYVPLEIWLYITQFMDNTMYRK